MNPHLQHRWLTGLLLVGLGAAALSAGSAWAEKIELVTYYPSPAAAGGGAPTSPQTVYLETPPNTHTTYDVYTALRLWETGKKRENVTIKEWKAYLVDGDGKWSALQSGTTSQLMSNSTGFTMNWTTTTTVVPPVLRNGVITVRRQEASTSRFGVTTSTVSGDLYEVTVQW